MKWLNKELTVFGSFMICSVIAMKLDIWNVMFMYWLIKICVELVWDKDEQYGEG